MDELLRLIQSLEFESIAVSSVDVSSFDSAQISAVRMNLLAIYDRLSLALDVAEETFDKDQNDDSRRVGEYPKGKKQKTRGTERERERDGSSLLIRFNTGEQALPEVSQPLLPSVSNPGTGTILEEYEATSSFLTSKGYYSGLFAAVNECFQYQNTFMIVDSPSGSGKTLFGIALRQHFSKAEETTVVHLIWPEAVGDQDIYEELLRESRKTALPDEFFCHIRSMNFHEINVAAKFETIWDATLKHLFQDSFDSRLYKEGHRRLLLIIDEIPQDPYSVGQIGKLRDLVKHLRNVRLCLTGTNSKAANMVSLSQGAASSSSRVVSGSPWAVIITRLPRFDIDCLHIGQRWQRVTATPKTELVVECIRSSFVNGGNARSIVMAIKCAERIKSELFEDAKGYFDCWQLEFAMAILANKFDKTSYSETSKGLIGQLNLLLDASYDSDISDVLLGYHFAIRAIPDNGATSSSKQNALFAEVGGWLLLATDEVRGLGSSLYFVAGPLQPSRDQSIIPENGTISWQRTVFPRPESDCLLYLGAARENGYFSTKLVRYKSWQAVKAFWTSHAAGFVNFQNSSAVLNTGSSIEVLLAIAIPNAAIVSTCLDDYNISAFPKYIGKFCLEIGIPKISITALNRLDAEVLRTIMIPRIIMPGSTILPMLREASGCLSRQANKDQYDLLLQVPSSTGVAKIRFEANSREKLSTAETAVAGRKLVNGECVVGVLVVTNCCQFWGSKDHNLRKRRDLRTCLAGKASKIGAVIFIDGDGLIEFERVSAQPGYLFLIKVPETSLV